MSVQHINLVKFIKVYLLVLIKRKSFLKLVILNQYNYE